jgi:hydrogenase nickel incorporation protein HypA/HybF
MHETALALSLMKLVEEVARQERAVRVRAIEVELGALSCVEPEAFAQAVEAAALGHLAEGAKLVLDRPPGQARCMACGADVTLKARGEPCPHCGSHRLLVTAGEDMRLKAVEVV